MQSNLVQISNIFNLMVQADSRLEFYHFGWRSDINRNIDNNFDQGTTTGRLFPAVQFHVPENTSHSQDGLSYLGNKEEIQITLYFDDLQDYNNDSSQKTDTLIEEWVKLKQIAEDFILNFNVLFCEIYGMGYIDSEVKYIPRSNLHNDKLITWQVSFMLVHTTPCTLEENQLNLMTFPSFIELYDFENYKKDVQVIKDSLQFDGVNEKLNASNYLPYDFESDDPWSIEIWFYPLQLQTSMLMAHNVSDGGSGSTTGWQFLLLSDGRIRFDIQTPGFFVSTMFVFVSSYNINQWNHIVLTKANTKDANDVNIYLDNIDKTVDIIFNNLNNDSIKNTGQLQIFGSTGVSYFEGYGHVVRIWNRKLTAQEVDDLYNSVCISSPFETDNPVTDGNVLNLELGSATFTNNEFSLTDYSGTISGAMSENMEEVDKITNSPCNP